MNSDSEKKSEDQLSIPENVESNNYLELMKKIEIQQQTIALLKSIELKRIELLDLELKEKREIEKKKNIGINYLINILNNNNIY
jgi:hypothetical protein